MKICVTGITGFIGAAVCHRILNEGFVVVGTCRNYNNKNDLSRVSLFETGDIDVKTSWEAALKGADAVVHTAARTHVVNETAVDPLAIYRQVNLHGTANLARQAAESGVKRFIFLSSVKVNGEASPIAYTESDDPSPKDAYGISKMEAEQAFAEIADGTGMSVFILRPPLVYGPNVKANFLKLIRLVDRGMPLPLGSVDNQRSLIYVGNLADAIVRCIRHTETTSKTYLVRDGVDVATPELIRMIASALGKPARLFKIPPKLLRAITRMAGRERDADRLIESLIVDDTKIRQELNWEPPFTIEYGLKETIAWYKSVRK